MLPRSPQSWTHSLDDMEDIVLPEGDDNSRVEQALPVPRGSGARSVTRNAAANVIRLMVTSLVAVFLPGYLTHRMDLAVYGAWVLILQMSNYIAYLDFGVQTAIAKYISEFEAKHDSVSASRYASGGMAITAIASVLGTALLAIVSWLVPSLLHQLPAVLVPAVRISVMLIGVSMAARLATSAYLSVFLGLQQYQVPMYVTIAGRVLFAGFVMTAVAFRLPLTWVAAAGAAGNVLTALLQYISWRSAGYRIAIGWQHVRRDVLRKLISYCSVTAVWSVCALTISGLDVVVVGHYAFKEAGFYSIATAPTTLLLTIVAALLGPLLPAASAMSALRSPEEMGSLLAQATRFITLLLLVTGLPLIVAGYPILRLWVGHDYAIHSLNYLRILILANMIRNVCGPYANMVLATARQGVASISPIAEGVTNLFFSIFLARWMGAQGVALGTLIGAVIGVSAHLLFSMRRTADVLTLSPGQFLRKGILQPGIIALPWLLSAPFWWNIDQLRLTNLWIWVSTIASAGLMVVALSIDDRRRLALILKKIMH